MAKLDGERVFICPQDGEECGNSSVVRLETTESGEEFGLTSACVDCVRRSVRLVSTQEYAAFSPYRHAAHRHGVHVPTSGAIYSL